MSAIAHPETLARLEALYQAQHAAQKELAQARDYFYGDHPTRLTERQHTYLNTRAGGTFCANYCRLVVEAVAERLRVAGIDADHSPTARWLWDWWRAARLEALSTAVHLAAVRDGETFVLVDYDPQADRPRATLQPADDGSGGVTLHYDQDGAPLYAAKRWTVDAGPGMAAHRRLNLYYPERIEKYISTTTAPYWQPHPDAPEPLPWVARDGSPLGLPVVPFRNRAADGPGGTSEISDVIPLQDALNKTLIDLLALADANAFPLLVALGFDVPDDFAIAPGSLVQVPPSLDGRTDFKIIPGTDAGNLLALLEQFVVEIARVSSTPLSRLQVSGQVAAEGTLKQQEAGLIAKVTRKQITFGDAWADVLGLAMRVQNAFGAGRVAADTPLTINWAPAAPRSESEHLQLLLLKAQLGVPVATLLAEAGYPPAEADDPGARPEDAPA
ncbi:MAG: phage portal protein [Anaerolineales bacterium]